MGDPGLVAGDLPVIAILDRAGAQAAQIGPGIRFGEHRRRQDFPAGDARQPVRFLFIRAAAEDQFRRDFAARAKAADPDIATRQFLADDDHRRLGQAQPAEIFRNGQAKNAQLGQLVDDLDRDQLVIQMPLMRKGHDLCIGPAPELIADHFQFFVQARLAKGRRAMIFGDQHRQPCPRRRGVAGHQFARRVRWLPIDAHIGQARKFGLAHHDAAEDLGQIFPEPDLGDQRFDLAFHLICPAAQLAQRLDIGRQPGQRMGGVLMGFQQRRIGLAAIRHQAAHGVGGARLQGVEFDQNRLILAGHVLHPVHPWPILRRCSMLRAFAGAAQL